MPILLSEYGDNEGKNLVARSLVIAAGILLTRLGVGALMDGLALISTRLYGGELVPLGKLAWNLIKWN